MEDFLHYIKALLSKILEILDLELKQPQAS